MRAVFYIIFALLVSCFQQVEESKSSKADKNEPYSPSGEIVYYGDLSLKEGITFSVNVKTLFDSAPSSWFGYTFSLQNAPSWLDINASTGEMGGVPSGSGKINIVIEAKKTAGADYSQSLVLAVNGDPLRSYAWHIQNTGQKSFSYKSGASGYDLNTTDVYKKGITGEGVRVVVSDTGVEINHDDLYPNSLAGEHKDYTRAAPYYGIPTANNFHGTAVASIIGAKGWNNKGSMGIAPNAKFAGYQFLESPQTSSMLINQASGDFDVFNFSYGDFLPRDTTSDASYLAHIDYNAQNGREGLGSIYVKSAGNEFYGKGEIGCFSHNANAPYENESVDMIIVGAMNAEGLRSDYSNAGSNLWVSAPGGQNARGDGPAIIAADLPTCFKGASKATSSPLNSFEYGHELNPKCNYTSVMNGTSSAAPNVSGVIALILEADPTLSNREVKHILASTARKIDASSQAWPYLGHPGAYVSGCPSFNMTGHEYEQGWTANAAGVEFHNYYGFGLVDGNAAVEMALSGVDLTDKIVQNPDWDASAFDSGLLGLPIPDHDPAGVTHTLRIDQAEAPGTNSDFIVESVQVKIEATHEYSGELGVELTSPSGTKSILMNINNSFLNPENGNYDSDLNMVLTTHAFYGEPMFAGSNEWTIKVIDGLEEVQGSLKRWRIKVHGRNP